MSFESCPTCGYALSTTDHQCRHCHASFKTMPGVKKMDMRFMAQILIAAGIVILLGRLFLFH
jgi:hypothetical protein